MHINDVLFLVTIPKQDQELSPCSCSRLSLPGRGYVLVRCSQTVTGLNSDNLTSSYSFLEKNHSLNKLLNE